MKTNRFVSNFSDKKKVIGRWFQKQENRLIFQIRSGDWEMVPKSRESRFIGESWEIMETSSVHCFKMNCSDFILPPVTGGIQQEVFPIQKWPYFSQFCIIFPKYSEKRLHIFQNVKVQVASPKTEIKTLNCSKTGCWGGKRHLPWARLKISF